VRLQVFLGSLREIELERVKEKLSSAIMETCLALTIFREEFNLSFVGMFTVLTFVKVFHWLVQDRVDYIEVTPSVSRLAHTRIVSFLIVLLVRAGGLLAFGLTAHNMQRRML
jgi:E3 ubiquitin-protein ligase synoviolin